MSAELVAVQGCTYKFTDSSQATAQAMISVTSQPSQKAKAEGNGIYTSPIQFTLSAVLTSKITNGDGSTLAPGSLTATAQYTKAEGKSVMRKGDKVQVNVQGHAGDSTVTDVVTVEIDDAGQTTVKGS